MSISEDDCFLSFPIENSLYKETHGLRYRDQSRDTSLTNTRSKEMVRQPMFMYGQNTISEVQTAEDSGYLEDHNLSFADSPGCVRTSTPGSQWEVESHPDLATVMEENEASSFPEFQISAKSDETVGKKKSGNNGRLTVHILAFRGLILAVLLGACGFGFMLTFRSSKETLGRWKENGKYRAMEFARESIEGRLRGRIEIQNGSIFGQHESYEEKENMNVPESVLQKFEDELDYPDDPSNFRAAHPVVEDLDYPDDPYFRPVIPSKKRSQPY